MPKGLLQSSEAILEDHNNAKMNYSNLFKIAFKSITNNKMRSFLTMLGVIIGITAVIVMISIGQGSKSSIRGEISSMGSNLINIWPQSRERSGARSAVDMQSLKMSDYEAIKRESELIKAVTPVFTSSGQVIFGNQNSSTTLYGVNEDYLKIQSFTVETGEMFNTESISQLDKVCLVGSKVVKNLFDGNNEAALGSIIRFNNIPFRIIGVLSSKGSSGMGTDQDNMVIAPYSTVQKRVMAINFIPSIMAAGISEEMSAQTVDELSAILRQQHGITDGRDDFEIMSMDEVLKTVEGVMDKITWLLAAIAFISLIVGGVGIMNIMYVSVTERTREIGLRMSIGAKGYQILLQFLIEAMMISITGGIIGILLGGFLVFIIGLVLSLIGSSLTMIIQPASVIISFLVCTFTGIFFGWYPARKAANLNPIDALRYE